MYDEVKVFLLGKGVESESLDKGVFKVTEQIQAFLNAGGRIFACGTCLEIHGLQAPESFMVATLKNIHEIVEESDKVITF